MDFKQVVELWNNQADEFNSWESLSVKEQVEWALKCKTACPGSEFHKKCHDCENMEDRKTIIFFKETFLQSVISDAWTFAGILLCIWFAESNGSVFWLSVSCVGLFIWMIPIKPHQKKFKSREDLY